MKITVVSDIHYACPLEQARRGFEIAAVESRWGKVALKLYRDHVWLKDPCGQNHLFDQFLEKAGPTEFVVANGDYSCDTAFIGVSDDAACQSAKDCLSTLRERFGKKFQATFGDHELGKINLVGTRGGMRLSSWKRALSELCLQPFWRVEFGNYVLVGIVSTLVALPIFEPEMLPEERDEWYRLRETHLGHIDSMFSDLKPNQRVLLFCHDPTALPFLWKQEAVRCKLPQVEHTIIGHLHSPLVFWKSRLLAGMPPIRFLGNSIRKFSLALREARHWKAFRVSLCPSLAGVELLKDGGFLELDLDPDARRAAKITRIKIER